VERCSRAHPRGRGTGSTEGDLGAAGSLRPIEGPLGKNPPGSHPHGRATSTSSSSGWTTNSLALGYRDLTARSSPAPALDVLLALFSQAPAEHREDPHTMERGADEPPPASWRSASGAWPSGGEASLLRDRRQPGTDGFERCSPGRGRPASRRRGLAPGRTA
jgi:hypothetical protein